MGNEERVSFGEEVCLKGTNVLEVCRKSRSTLRVHPVGRIEGESREGAKKGTMRPISQNKRFFFSFHTFM